MTIKQHLKKNATLAYPVVIGQLGHIMVTVADTAMVGQVGVVPLAGATFAGTIYYILMVFGLGMSYAITPLVAATDPKDRPKTLTYLQNGLVLNVTLGVLLFLLALSVIPFLSHFGQEDQVVVAARPYLLIICCSLVPLMVYQTFRQFSEGLSDTFNPMLVSVLANLTNVGLNYVFIFGKFGLPAMGLVGAGYATLISRVVMAILMVVLTRRKWIGIVWKLSWRTIRHMIKLGTASGLQYIFEVGAFATAAIMVGWLGASALAAHQIALNLAAISYMAATGIAAASTIRIGNQIGLKDKRNLRIAGFSCLAMVAVFMAGAGLIFIFFRHELTALYVKDQNVRDIAAGLLIIAAAFQVSDGTQAVGLGVLRGLTDVKVPTLVTFIAFWVLAIPAGYLLGFVFGLGINGIWYALLGGLTIASIMHFIRFNRLSNRLRF